MAQRLFEHMWACADAAAGYFSKSINVVALLRQEI